MKESEVQKKIMNMLTTHPKVAWAYVTSSGYVKGVNGGRMFKVGVPGMSDIMGQLKDGRLFAIEVKAPGNKPTELQQQFIADVNKYGGQAGWADSVETAINILEDK